MSKHNNQNQEQAPTLEESNEPIAQLQNAITESKAGVSKHL